MEYIHPDDIIKCKLPMFDDEGGATSQTPIATPQRPQRTKSGISEAESEASNDSSITATAATIEPPRKKLLDLSTSPLRKTRDVTGKPSYSTEVRLRMKSGEYRWHLVRVLLAEPLVSEDSENETWYGTCTDINVSDWLHVLARISALVLLLHIGAVALLCCCFPVY